MKRLFKIITLTILLWSIIWTMGIHSYIYSNMTNTSKCMLEYVTALKLWQTDSWSLYDFTELYKPWSTKVNTVWYVRKTKVEHVDWEMIHSFQPYKVWTINKYCISNNYWASTQCITYMALSYVWIPKGIILDRNY